MTANAAAAEVRHAILRKMRYLEQATAPYITMTHRWGILSDYIKGMAPRASAKKGGLGRK